MTTSTLDYPLSASATRPEICSYGSHKVPLDMTGSFDLPRLLPQQADSHLPLSSVEFVKWGRKNRVEHAEAVHFYASDNKFENALRHPDQVIDVKPTYFIEPNISTDISDPLAVALSGLWRKRCVSRVLQDHGLRCIIDLNVTGLARGLVTEGVSREHTLWGTKYQVKDLSGNPVGIDGLIDDWELANEHVDPSLDFDFIVYGGGERIRQECELNNWIWIPNANTVATRGTD